MSETLNPLKPIAYSYTRVSTVRQDEEGMSLGAQKELCRKFYDFALAGKGVLWGDCYVDGGVSAVKTPFANRPAGKVLAERLRPGDHVIMSRLDRGFRNFRDCINTMEVWVSKGIHVHYLDLGVSTNTHGGRFILRIFAAVAELNRDMAVEQIKMGLDRRKQLCGTATRPNRGWKIVGPKKHPRRVPDYRVQGVAMLAMRLRQEQDLSFEEIYRLFRDKGLRTEKGKIWGLTYIKTLVRDCHDQMWNVPEAKFPDSPPPVPKDKRYLTKSELSTCGPSSQTEFRIDSIVTPS